MHKHSSFNLNASILFLFAAVLIGIGISFDSSIFEKNPTTEKDIIANNQIQNELKNENAEYLLLLPPKQEVSASRAPLPDIDYNIPKDKRNYLAIGHNLNEMLQSKKIKAKLQEQEAILWEQAVLKALDKNSFKSPKAILLFADEKNHLQNIKIPLNVLTSIVARRDEQGDITASKHVLPTHVHQHLVSVEITHSLYQATIKADLPTRYLNQIIYNYSFDVDFQRDIRKGDLLELLYETVNTDSGEILEYRDILFMNLVVNRKGGGKAREVFLYRDGDDSKLTYYDEWGISIEKSLLKTPIDGARLSSGFGYRRHPILGYNKLHKGVDFAAPTGTPIYAAGDGIVEYAGRFGNYGKYIRLRHGGHYKTVYAHLSGFGKGIKKGATVRQKQIIGYVGSTGRSTGPHLHYEILENGKAVNPRKLALPSNKKLEGDLLYSYQSHYRSIQGLFHRLRNRDSIVKDGIASYFTIKEGAL